MIGPRLRGLCVRVLPILTACGCCLGAALGASAFPQSPQNPPAQQQSPPPRQQQTAPPTQPQNRKIRSRMFRRRRSSSANNRRGRKITPALIDSIEFRGQRRIPQDTLRALILSRKGDVYSEEAIHRDFMALWNTGRFDDLTVEKETAPDGGIIVRFVVTERRVVRSIDYTGNKSITKSEILDRFKERKVGLSPESQFDPGKVQRAKNVLLEYEAERGRQYATVTPEIRQVPPASVEVNFKIDEGPKVKVGKIDIEGNKVFNDRTVIRAMKNLKPIGIPHSILFEDICLRAHTIPPSSMKTPSASAWPTSRRAISRPT